MGIYQWSTTAGDNDDAATDINWAEGQAPSTVNDSARELMADVAEWLQDISCAVTTGGTASALTLTTTGTVPALADGVILGFIAGSAANAGATLNVDSLGAKELRRTNDTVLQTSDVVSGGAYLVVYDASADSGNGAWLVLNPTITTAEQLSGTLSDARLSANVPLLDEANAFTSGGDTSFAGNVGIGTTSPVSKLEVNGLIAAAGGSVSAPAYRFAGDTDTGMWSPAANTIVWSTGGSESLRVSGNVTRIGSEGNGAVLIVHGEGTGSPEGGEIRLLTADDHDTSVAYWGIDVFQDDLRIFEQGGVPAIHVKAGGNVGIGTTNPGAELDVNGGIIVGTGVFSGALDGSVGIAGGDNAFNSGANISVNGPNHPSANDISFRVGTSTKLRWDDSQNFWRFDGKVGIFTNPGSSDLNVGGSLSKNSGSFKIDHPLPALSDTHYLVHSFVEAPTADLVYSGMVQLVDGVATVDIDAAAGMTSGTFEALTNHARRHTSNEDGFAAVRSTLSGSTLTIECEDATSTDTVFWMVLAERADPHMLETDWTDENGRVIVEPQKGVA